MTRYIIKKGRIKIDAAKEIQNRCPGFPPTDFIALINTLNSFAMKIYILRKLEVVAGVFAVFVGVWIFGGVLGSILWNWQIMLPLCAGLLLLNVLIVGIIYGTSRLLRSRVLKSVQQYVDRKNSEFASHMKIKVVFVEVVGYSRTHDRGRVLEEEDPTKIDYVDISFH